MVTIDLYPFRQTIIILRRIVSDWCLWASVDRMVRPVSGVFNRTGCAMGCPAVLRESLGDFVLHSRWPLLSGWQLPLSIPRTSTLLLQKSISCGKHALSTKCAYYCCLFGLAYTFVHIHSDSRNLRLVSLDFLFSICKDDVRTEHCCPEGYRDCW
jgi:hypothetical protein